jgi:GT2 family glycosyltransferase
MQFETSADPPIAILCVTHGRPDLVRQCLQSCMRQDYPNFEIVVIVNPCDPSSEAAVHEAAPIAKLIRTHRNLGFFPALNIAIANTNADYVMIVDDDARFIESDALSRLVSEFRREPTLGAVTCNLEGPHETPISDDRYVRAFTTGFTMMPRRIVAELVGYVPDLFFRSAGETFWCTSLWEQRRPVKKVASVRMYHALAQQGRSTRDWRFYGLRSQILCAVMREPASWLVPVLASKFGKSLIQYIRWRSFGVWCWAWSSAVGALFEAIRYRQPVSAATRRLLYRLEIEPIRDLAHCREWLDAAPLSRAT